MVTKVGKIVPIQHICIFGDDSDKTILERADYYVFSSSAILILTTALSLNQNSYIWKISVRNVAFCVPFSNMAFFGAGHANLRKSFVRPARILELRHCRG